MPKKLALGTLCCFLLLTTAWAASDQIINDFSGSDGSEPIGSLALDSAGNIYGTTLSGGSYGFGNVYELIDDGGIWKESVLYNFTGGIDGGSPNAGMIFDKSGRLYGTTLYGGNPNCSYNGQSGCGVVFQLTNSGGSWTETVLHTFGGGEDGAELYAGLVMDSEGVVYGGTLGGGTGTCNFGCGTVFSLREVNGAWKETVLYSFKNNGKDGIGVESSLTLDSKGNLYGTTDNGGNFKGCQQGCGTVFKLSSPNTRRGRWKETILYSFNGADGAYPDAPVILDKAGNLFGTTYSGGTSDGTVFELRHSGNKYVEHVILSIDAFPYGLAMDFAGNLFGAATAGGTYGCGSIFELKPKGWKYVDVHDFQNDSTDGCNPVSGPTLDSSDNLYGTTYAGGSSGDGVVYKVSR
jgi:uncharacterized repeat protein (TIGR03803 family)